VVDAYIAFAEIARRRFVLGGSPAERIVTKPRFSQSDPGVGEWRSRYLLFVRHQAQEKRFAAWEGELDFA
jgi:hypothetical protein